MKITSHICILTALILLPAITGWAQYKTTQEAIDFINDRLSHSFLQKIDADGTVTIGTPSKKVKFRIQDASFNYNGSNNDDRVRVFCDECIQFYEKKKLTGTESRQSFLCDSKAEADEVITAFRFLKKNFPENQKSLMQADKILKVNDTTLGARNVGEAVDFINDNLSYSMVMGVDEKGIMTINAPSEIYRVNLAKADFQYNELDGSKVRIYGDFCLEVKDNGGDWDFISRKSFQAPSRSKAYKIITVLYYLKSTFGEMDPSTIPSHRNVSGKETDSYHSVGEAVDYINNRLAYSIILGIDDSGVMTINAPDNIYRLKIKEADIHRSFTRKVESDWFPIETYFGPVNAVVLECDECIKRYESPDSYDVLDEQTFQCQGSSDVREVLKALAYIKGNYKQ